MACVFLIIIMPFSYRFILVNIGEAGHYSDGGTLSNSSFGQALDNELLSIPQPSLLLNTTGPPLSYVIVGDKAFPLKCNMMRPYPG